MKPHIGVTLASFAVAFVLAGCESASHPTAPIPTSTAAVTVPTPTTAAISADIRLLRIRGDSVDYHITSSFTDGTPFFVFHSICTGSADGHCQAVDVFRPEVRKAIWRRDYVSVLGIRTARGGFIVRAASYARNDPLGFPSLPPVNDTYTWNGSSFTEQGPLPRNPGG